VADFHSTPDSITNRETAFFWIDVMTSVSRARVIAT
jgi:hypothetical protein